MLRDFSGSTGSTLNVSGIMIRHDVRARYVVDAMVCFQITLQLGGGGSGSRADGKLVVRRNLGLEQFCTGKMGEEMY